MVHPDRRKQGVVVESPTRVAERTLWQPSPVVPESGLNEPGLSSADPRRVPLPATPDATRHAGFLR
jgi:hypothetical protein